MRVYFKVTFLIFHILIINVFSAAPDPVITESCMVVSASKLATDAGVEILKKGGNAVDAAVATGFALSVSYPAAGNIGGGGFFVIKLADGRETTIDFREKAPGKAFRDMFLDSLGNYNPELSTASILASGVPGSVAGLLMALEKYGTMSPEEVLQPAIKLAEEGFRLEYRAARSLNYYRDEFLKYTSSSKIFTKSDTVFFTGDLFIQKDLAATLREIAEHGRKGFYEGKTARLICEQSDSMNGFITMKDLAEYKPVERKPLRGDYRGYEIISMGPPSSGGAAIIQSLNALENYKFIKKDFGSARHYFLLSEVWKHVYADRAKHLGDMDYYDVPLDWLTSREYAGQIVRSIGAQAISSEVIYAGNPPAAESEETTHYSVLDAAGNAVSATVTLNSSYGNKIAVEGAGFLLNNEMDDFSAKPGTPNQFGLLGSEANSIEPGKRMLSSMTPTIVLKDGKPFLIIGSPGGSTIITVVNQVIMNVIDFEMDISQAISAPRIHHQWMPDRIDYEEYGLPREVEYKLLDFGENMGSQRILGRAEGILIMEDGKISGASDPRGYGKAAGF